MSQMGRATPMNSLAGRLSPVPILQVATGFWASQALLTAVELRVFTLLFGGAKSSAELATEMQVDAPALEALLDANCALGFLQRHGERYRNSEVSNAFLVEGSPGSYVDLVRFMRDPLFGVWQALRDTVRNGESPIPAGEMDATEVALARAFHNGAYATTMRVAEILDLEFSGYSRMIEMGGHSGAGSLCLARRYPQLGATILDRPPFQPLAEELIQASKLEDRVRFQPGNPDEGSPGADVDLVLLPHVLSRRSRAAIPDILTAVRQSLRSGGALIVTEFLLEDSKAEPREAALFRLNVVASYGPKNAGSLTRSELYGLLRDAGFTNVDMVGLPMFGITAITATRD
jgi:hypothetical protein